VHSADLKRLAREADVAAELGDIPAQLSAWRTALDLLPPETRQHAQVLDKVNALSDDADGGKLPAPAGQAASAAKSGKGLGWVSAGGVLLWKFKTVALMLLTKGKFLLAGLTKLPTLFSMLLTMGIYFTLWGWKFAVGFVLSIYVHEMGHVAALRRLGIAASAPMFIPGFGAYVRLHQYPSSPSEDARVGLAGPIWGLGAALACYAMYFGTEAPLWAALAHTGAYLNLFNLIPVWQLDGARGFHALNKRQRLAICAIAFAAWLVTHETMLLPIAGFGLFRAFASDVPERPDARAFGEFAMLLAVLAWLAGTPVPGVHQAF
jgi:Zn-dependent protease